MRQLVATLALWSVASAAVAGDNLVVPADIYGMIKARGCDQVSDFYDRPAVESPPYALIVGDGAKMQVAVWCTADGAKPQSQRTYTLLLKFDDASHPLARCPAEIRGIKHIGGLQFIDVADDASSYFFVGTTARVRESGSLRTKGISSSYDGVGANYVCVDGRWAFRSFD